MVIVSGDAISRFIHAAFLTHNFLSVSFFRIYVVVSVPVSASFFHSSSQQCQRHPFGTTAKLKCIYLFCTTYNWKSLTFCTRTCVKQRVKRNLKTDELCQ